METCINYCEPGFAYISSDEWRWIQRVRSLADDHPDECFIMKQPEDNGGFIYAKLPQKWVKINPPRKGVPLSPEERAIRTERLLQNRYVKQNKEEKDEVVLLGDQ